MGIDRPSDEQLSAEWQSGDRDAGTLLVGRYQPSIRRFLERRVGSQCDDVAQEVWAAVTRMIPTYRQRSSFRTWLFAIANNHVRVAYRSRARTARIEALATDLFDIPKPDPSQAYSHHQELSQLADGLEALPAQLQRIVALYYFERYPASAIGRRLSLPENTVRSRVRRARQLLGNRLTKRAPARDGRASMPPALLVESWLLTVVGTDTAGPVHHAA